MSLFTDKLRMPTNLALIVIPLTVFRSVPLIHYLIGYRQNRTLIIKAQHRLADRPPQLPATHPLPQLLRFRGSIAANVMLLK